MATQDDYSADTSTTGKLVIPVQGAVAINGSIETKGDHDWFKVTLEMGTRYIFKLASPNGLLTLRDADGNVLNGSSNLTQRPFVPDHTGVYFLDVGITTGQTIETYRLAAYILPGDDYPSHIQDIPPVVVGDAATINRFENFSGDHDWIPVQLSAGKNYAVQGLFYKEAIGTSTPGHALDAVDVIYEAFISLRDSQGQLVPDMASHGRDFTFSTPISGVYYLDVSGGTKAALNIVPYQDDYAGNSTTQGQMALPDKQVVSVNGHVEASGDHDWFKVPLTAGKQILFSVKPANAAQGSLQFPVIHLYDSTGKALVTGADAGQISFTAKSSGNYYVDVSGWVDRVSPGNVDNSKYTGTYTVTATQKVDDYGNDRLAAGRFDFGVSDAIVTALVGNIETKGDDDWLAVKLLAGRSYFFSLSGAGSAKPVAGQLNTVALALHNAQGVLIDQGTGYKGYTSKIEYMPVKSGTYYLDVSALKNTETGHYSLNELSYKDDYPGYSTTIKPLEPGETITGNFEFQGDRDFIAVNAVAGARYDIWVTPNSYYSLYYDDFVYGPRYYTVALRDTAGALLSFKYVQHTYNAPDFIQFTAPKSGLFYIDIGGTINRPHVVHNNSTTYSVGINAYKDDYSAGQSTIGKLSLSSNNLSWVTGTWDGGAIPPVYKDSGGRFPRIFPLGGQSNYEADWFKVSLQAGKTYTVALTANQGALAVKNNVSVLDASGTAVKPVATSDDSVSFIASRTGIYYLSAHTDSAPSYGHIPYTLIGQQGVPIGTNKNEVMNGGDGADLLFGRGGGDTINGGNGRDIINGGTGKDVMMGGAGNDYYFVDDRGDVVKETSTLATEKDIVLSTISYALPANVETLILVGQREGASKLAVLGLGNQLDNTLIGQSTLLYRLDTEILRGGTGNDTLINKSYGAGGQRYLYGEAGNDTLSGYGHLIGGVGNDTYEIKGSSTVKIDRGDSLPTGFDVIKGFVLAGGSSLDLNSAHIAQDIATVNGKDTGAIHSHHISKGLISFDDINTYTTPLAITADKIADAIKYLQTNITKPGDTVAFVAGHDTYVFQDGGSVDTLVQLVGVTAESIHNTAVKGAIFLV